MDLEALERSEQNILPGGGLTGNKTMFRYMLATKYQNTIDELKNSDDLLVSLHSLASNPLHYTLPFLLRKKDPLFCLKKDNNIGVFQ